MFYYLLCMRYYLQCFYCQTGSAMYAKCILLGMPSYLLLLWCNMCSRWISTDTNNIVFLLMNKYSFFLVWLQPCACLFCDYPPIITHRRVQVQTRWGSTALISTSPEPFAAYLPLQFTAVASPETPKKRIAVLSVASLLYGNKTDL
jgi:hypothetical protein